MPDKGNDLQADGARVLVDAVIDTIRGPILVLDRQQRIFSANEAFLQLSGLSRTEIEGQLLHEVGEGSWSLPELRQLLAELPRDEAAHDLEVSHQFKDVGRRKLLLNARRIDPLELILLVVQDITEGTEAREQHKLLLAELKHRVKNTLALVQSVAVHTGRRSPSIDQFMIAFGERLRALGHVHDLVVRTDSSGADLRHLVEQMLANYGLRPPGPVEIKGERIDLNARQGQSVGLALHELASNAVRHGALSAPAGRLRIAWRTEARDGVDWLRLSWQEDGGPRVAPPASSGFGRTVIERACAYELGGTADLRFDPAGVRYELAFPLE